MECEKVAVRRYGGGSLYFLIPSKIVWLRSIQEGDEFLCKIAEDGIKYVEETSEIEEIEELQQEVKAV